MRMIRRRPGHRCAPAPQHMPAAAERGLRLDRFRVPCNVAAAATCLVIAAPALAGERAPLKPRPNVPAGEVQGTRAFTAFSYKDGRIRAYVCDGTLRRRRATTSQWSSGRRDGR